MVESEHEMAISDKRLVKRLNPSWKKLSTKVIRRNWAFFVFWLGLSLLVDHWVDGLDAIVGSVIIFWGLYLFFRSQRDSSRLQLVSGLGIMLLGSGLFWTGLVGTMWVSAEIYEAQQSVSGLTGNISRLIYVIAINYLVVANGLDRKLFLHHTLSRKNLDTGEYLKLLHDFVAVYWGDVNVHQRYVEALFLHGYLKDAIVEAKMLLKLDPYNFGATLLLAQGYFEVGLFQACEEVCERYLALSGYSFEFADLKAQCQRRKVCDAAV